MAKAECVSNGMNMVGLQKSIHQDCALPLHRGGNLNQGVFRSAFLVVALTLTCAGALVFGQGNLDPPGLTVLRTGSGEPLQTSVQTLMIPGNVPGLELWFEFGFATDELLLPGEISDSYTVTVQDTVTADTLILLTSDAGGVVWAPPTPGCTFLPPETVMHAPIEFPSIDPVMANQTAFAVRVKVPSTLAGPVNVYFDLFDNLNSTDSLGWHGPVVLVPEPRIWLVLSVGLLVLFVRRSS